MHFEYFQSYPEDDICMENWIERGNPLFYDVIKKPRYQMDQETIDKITDVLENNTPNIMNL